MISWSPSCLSFLLRTGRSLAEETVCSDAIGPGGVLQDTGGRITFFTLQDSKQETMSSETNVKMIGSFFSTAKPSVLIFDWIIVQTMDCYTYPLWRNPIKRESYLLQAEPKMGYNGVDSVEKTQNVK